MVRIEDVQFGEIADHVGPWMHGAPAGLLYVVEFSSGWVKVGQTASSRSDDERIEAVGRDYRAVRGWEITNRWVSDVRLSTERRSGTEYFGFEDERRSDLNDAEDRVKAHAIRTGGQKLSDVDPMGCTGETEVFQGLSFGDLVAYADVVGRCG